MKALTNYRYHVLFLVGLVAVLGLLSTPAEGASSYWLALIAGKAIGFTFAAVWYMLLRIWDNRGELPELANLINED